VVAHLLWGSGPSLRGAQRALDYADRVVTRLEEENAGRARGQALSKIETRIWQNDFEVREEAEGMRLTGYAARFGEWSEPLPFREIIKRGAFRRSLDSRNDIKLLWNHDSSKVLGSTRAKTLKLEEREEGLWVDALLPDTSYGRDAKVSIQRGDVTGFSFGFSVPAGGDAWNSEGTERTLKSVRLIEVSTGVAFPAYPSTNGTAQVRGLEIVAERAYVDVDDLADAIVLMEAGGKLPTEAANILRKVIDALAEEEEMEEQEPTVGEIVADATETNAAPEPDMGDVSVLELIKKKLYLLERN
jgi:HK97 family phage prohead protease